ncbi:helix-turn-helix transcriptional regulator [Clostridium botulinum]|uniref:helix-turn-helix domain-containing protein n=1 Tax=Clostridium botulinum TaxID=1491 RepID=UPI0013F0D4DF|nr:helix-turn-helix transcriptional regulator [Clostridium botulinum]MBY6789252.1 helix-turn-helix transcriptional regulator [Clostridium botulinum]MBY6946601.1 helix-turn-helix transcriptional regulator [Clostridium botulinum]MBY7020229.1 helix-turn-helix transcriptional regulator [Clostridium botulinum]NFG76232.1 helix-turn-helix transcriptional regulator [Clostridium botulinum]NFH70128.1 helix-turn-helix transcriptional regulator [Clostridium botulinum]
MNVNLLKSQIALRGKTIKEIAEKLKISKSAMYRKMYGKSEFTRAEISILIDYLEINFEKAIEIFFAEKVS